MKRCMYTVFVQHAKAQVCFPCVLRAETTKLLWYKWQTEGQLLYDALQQVEVVHRANGRGDRRVPSICCTAGIKDSSAEQGLKLAGCSWQHKQCCW